MSKEDKKAAEATPESKEQTTIRWDGANMRSTYANVCNVSSTREEVSLMFGTNKNWHPAQKELTIELSDRLILNPFAAKRLAVLLMNTMNEYEKRFGTLEGEAPERKNQ
jgi:hypothetical protein